MFTERPPLRVQLILIKRAAPVMSAGKKPNNIIKLIKRGWCGTPQLSGRDDAWKSTWSMCLCTNTWSSLFYKCTTTASQLITLSARGYTGSITTCLVIQEESSPWDSETSSYRASHQTERLHVDTQVRSMNPILEPWKLKCWLLLL